MDQAEKTRRHHHEERIAAEAQCLKGKTGVFVSSDCLTLSSFGSRSPGNRPQYAVGGGEEQGPSRPGEGIGDERLAQDAGEARIKRMKLNLRRSVSWRKAPDRVSNHRGAAACVEMLR